MWFSADTEHSASFLRLAEYTRNVCRWRGVQVLRVAKVLRGNNGKNGNNKPKVRTLKALKALKAHQTMNLIFRLEYAWICLNLTIVDSWTAHINFHHLSLRFTKSQPPTRCRRAVDKTWHGRDGHCGMAWAQRWKRRNLSHQHFEGLAIRPCLAVELSQGLERVRQVGPSGNIRRMLCLPEAVCLASKFVTFCVLALNLLQGFLICMYPIVGWF